MFVDIVSTCKALTVRHHSCSGCRDSIETKIKWKAKKTKTRRCEAKLVVSDYQQKKKRRRIVGFDLKLF